MPSNFPVDLDRLLSVDDAKTMLCIGTTTLYKLCRDGKLHPIKLSKRCTRFRVSEIRAFINAHTDIGGAV